MIKLPNEQEKELPSKTLEAQASIVLSYLNFALAVLFVFLVFFEKNIALPPVVQVLGRMHPLVLHIPIGGLVLLVVLYIFPSFRTTNNRPLFAFLLSISAFSALVTALFGLFLAQEGGYEIGLLQNHKIAGLLTAVLSYLLVWVFATQKKQVFGLCLYASLGLLLYAGHQGGQLTHGANFMLTPILSEKEQVVGKQSSAYSALIAPIFKEKCESCHNASKQKGGLDLSSKEAILRGGENGPLWTLENPGLPLLFHLNLPLEDKKHMPPAGKPQLSKLEIDLISAWLKAGADFEKKWTDYPEQDDFHALAGDFFEKNKKPSYSFSPASESAVEKAQSPFCSIRPLALGSPALSVSFFVKEKFQENSLEQLNGIRTQVVELSLNHMPVQDKMLESLVAFEHLEKLQLNDTKITNNGLKSLQKLVFLKELSLSNTRVSASILVDLKLFPALKKVYLWNTQIAAIEQKNVQLAAAPIDLIFGEQVDRDEILVLTPPMLSLQNRILKAKDSIALFHKMADVAIYYTTDGSMPDSLSSAIFKENLAISGFLQLRSAAFKQQWLHSPTVDYYIFSEGEKAQDVQLLVPPNPQYKGRGALTLSDSKLGYPENFRDSAWVAWREEPAEVLFHFEKKPTLQTLALSYLKNVPSYIFPPAEIELWGGNTADKLKFLAKKQIPLIGESEISMIRSEGLSLSFPPNNYAFYKVKIKNVQKLPNWHPGKGQTAWVFLDELIFN